MLFWRDHPSEWQEGVCGLQEWEVGGEVFGLFKKQYLCVVTGYMYSFQHAK